ncbi:hypothetical protein ACOSP7_027242 [Xanthoceras sorbifolium]
MKKLLSCFVSIFKSVIDSRTKENQAGGENKDQEKGRKDFLEMLLELTQQRDNKSSLAINQVKALLLVYENINHRFLSFIILIKLRLNKVTKRILFHIHMNPLLISIY